MVNRLRSIAEVVSRNIVFTRRMPADFGRTPVVVSPGAALHYWLPNLENIDPVLFSIIRQYIQPRHIVWDIGANLGLFTFAASYIAGSAGKVLAVEADPWCATLLRRTCLLAQNRHLSVDVLSVAIADKPRIAKFNIAKRGRATNFLADVLASSQIGGIRETHLVPCVSLDWLLERYLPPNFLKIDIEGAEALALGGADNLLSRVKPIILCEVSSDNQQYVTETLIKHDYALYEARLPLGEQIKLATFNTLALPQ